MAPCFMGWWHDLNRRLGELGEPPATQADAAELFNDDETPLSASMRVLLSRIAAQQSAQRPACVGCE